MNVHDRIRKNAAANRINDRVAAQREVERRAAREARRAQEDEVAAAMIEGLYDDLFADVKLNK